MDIAQSALPETPLQTAADIVAATGLFSAEELKIFTQSLRDDPRLIINPLPQEIAVQQPQETHSVPQVYVNAKQYHCIMRRRAKRTRAAAKNQQLQQRKPFLHESRHQHAQKRRRGPGGRFLTKEERAAAQSQCDEFDRENTDGVLLTASNDQNANGSDKHMSQKMSAQTAPSTSMLVDDASQQPTECNAVKSSTILQPQSGSLQTKACLSLQ